MTESNTDTCRIVPHHVDKDQTNTCECVTLRGGKKVPTISYNRPNFGHFYCIIPVNTPFIKIGITTSSIHTLTSRYKMYYGEIGLISVDCEDYREKERYIKSELRRLNLRYYNSNELAINNSDSIVLYLSVSKGDMTKQTNSPTLTIPTKHTCEGTTVNGDVCCLLPSSENAFCYKHQDQNTKKMTDIRSNACIT